MEEQKVTTPTYGNTSTQSKAKPLLLTVLLTVLVLAAAGGAYYWQHNKVKNLNSKVASLNSQLSAATKSASPTTQKSSSSQSTFTYKSFGMTLTLPKSDGLIVKVEGNKGGAAGATYRVATMKNSNVFTDSGYQGIQIDIDNTFSSLSNAVSIKETQLDEARGAGSTVDRHYKVLDTTIAGLPAKLLTADGLDEYQGNLSVYLVGSGGFLYTITANGTQNSSFPLLSGVLHGLAIKPYKL